MTTQELRNKLEQQKGKKLQIEDDIVSLQRTVRIKTRHVHDLEKAREIIRAVGLETQKQLQYHISDIASLALDSIFDKPYKLVLDFVERRNKTECDILFERDGHYMKPLQSSGVGAVDVASFALRIASWSMARPRTDNVIMLDEPFKHLSKDLHNRASEMIKEISNKLGIQFIINTHEPILAEYSDRVFQTSIKNGVTKVKEV